MKTLHNIDGGGGTLPGGEAAPQPAPRWPPLPPARQFMQVGMSATTFADALPEAREQYRAHNAIHFRNLLDPALLAVVMKLCAKGGFMIDPEHVGAPEVEWPQHVGHLLDTVFWRPAFLRWVELATGCDALHTFTGRVTQTRAGYGERGWHDDLREDSKRRVALVVNLSPAPYEGAPFRLRLKTGERLGKHLYTEPGEAILFRVDPTLEHSVTPVTSGGPRRVYAGWGLTL